jgi:hypothetical protein
LATPTHHATSTNKRAIFGCALPHASHTKCGVQGCEVWVCQSTSSILSQGQQIWRIFVKLPSVEPAFDKLVTCVSAEIQVPRPPSTWPGCSGPADRHRRLTVKTTAEQQTDRQLSSTRLGFAVSELPRAHVGSFHLPLIMQASGGRILGANISKRRGPGVGATCSRGRCGSFTRRCNLTDHVHHAQNKPKQQLPRPSERAHKRKAVRLLGFRHRAQIAVMQSYALLSHFALCARDRHLHRWPTLTLQSAAAPTPVWPWSHTCWCRHRKRALR